jgi:hypothetical protein
MKSNPCAQQDHTHHFQGRVRGHFWPQLWKSTLLSVLGLLDTASSGTYQLAGHNVENISKKQRAQVRNRDIGFIFQSFNLISDLTIEENVALPLIYRSDISKSERHQESRRGLGQGQYVPPEPSLSFTTRRPGSSSALRWPEPLWVIHLSCLRTNPPVTWIRTTRSGVEYPR